MRVVIPSSGIPERMRAHEWASRFGLDWTLVVGTEAEADSAMTKVSHENIVVAGAPDLGQSTIAWIRNWIYTKYLPRDEWTMTIDDNVSHLTILPEPWYGKEELGEFDGLREEFLEPATSRSFWRAVNETIEKAEEQKTIFAAFSTDDNWFFRRKKWKVIGYCRTQCALFKNDGWGWYPWSELTFDDFFKTCDVLERYGSVVLNRYVKAQKKQFEAGGIGSLEERIPRLIFDCQEIMRRFPGLCRISKGRSYHLQFKPLSLKAIDRWRQEMCEIVEEHRRVGLTQRRSDECV